MKLQVPAFTCYRKYDNYFPGFQSSISPLSIYTASRFFGYAIYDFQTPIFDFGHSSVDFSRYPSIQIQALMKLRAHWG